HGYGSHLRLGGASIDGRGRGQAFRRCAQTNAVSSAGAIGSSARRSSRRLEPWHRSEQPGRRPSGREGEGREVRIWAGAGAGAPPRRTTSVPTRAAAPREDRVDRVCARTREGQREEGEEVQQCRLLAPPRRRLARGKELGGTTDRPGITGVYKESGDRHRE